MDCGQHIIRIARIYKNRRYPFKDQLTRTVFATALPKVVIMASADMGGDFCARGGVRAAGLFFVRAPPLACSSGSPALCGN